MKSATVAMPCAATAEADTGSAPPGWCEENTSMRFSQVKISSRLVKIVEPSCGTSAIGASRRIFAKSG